MVILFTSEFLTWWPGERLRASVNIAEDNRGQNGVIVVNSLFHGESKGMRTGI